MQNEMDEQTSRKLPGHDTMWTQWFTRLDIMQNPSFYDFNLISTVWTKKTWYISIFSFNVKKLGRFLKFQYFK